MRNDRRLWIVLTLWFISTASVNAQSPVVGTWLLESASTTKEDGSIDKSPFGQSPRGSITYTSDGWVAAVISYGGRRPLSADRVAAPPLERAEAFASSFSYAGQFEVKGDIVTHHVKIASVENWVGTDLVRTIRIDGDAMTLTTPKLSVNGKSVVTELVWRRLGAPSNKSLERTRER